MTELKYAIFTANYLGCIQNIVCSKVHMKEKENVDNFQKKKKKKNQNGYSSTKRVYLVYQ